MKIFQKGQSLFELVVAIAMSALVIVTIVSLVTNAIRSSTFSKDNALAAAIASDGMEWLRSQRDDNINTFLDNVTTPIWCFTTLDWGSPGSCVATNQIDNLFTREGDFTVSTPSGKTLINATINVYWNDSQGTHTVSNNSIFTDWRQR